MRGILAVSVGFALVGFWLLLEYTNITHAGGGYEAGVALSGQTVSILPTVIQCGKGITCAFGLYRATVSCMTTTPGKGKVSVSFMWSDFGNAQSLSSGPCDLTTAGSNIGVSSPLYLDGTANPSYQATVVNGGPGAAVWRANVVLERLQ